MVPGALGACWQIVQHRAGREKSRGPDNATTLHQWEGVLFALATLKNGQLATWLIALVTHPWLCMWLHSWRLFFSSKVNGHWSGWAEGSCSVSCGEGERIMTRTCTNPQPETDGEECFGSNQWIVPCNEGDCAGESNIEWASDSWTTIVYILISSILSGNYEICPLKLMAP